MKKQRIRVPINVVLIIGFGGLMLVAVASMFALGLSSTALNTRHLLGDKMETLVETMVAYVDAQLSPIHAQAKWIAQLVAEGRVDPSSSEQIDTLLISALAATPQVTGIGFIKPDLTIRRYQRRSKKITTENWSGLPDISKEFARTAKQSEPGWGKPFWAAPLDNTVVNLRTPLRRNGELFGVLALVVGISDFSLDMSTRIGNRGITPFILFDHDWVLAHPMLIDGSQDIIDDEVPLPRLSDFGDGVLSTIWTAVEDDFPDPSGGSQVTISTSTMGDNDKFVFVYRNIKHYGAIPWTVGVYFNRDIEAEVIERLLYTLWGGMAIVVLSILLSLVGGVQLGRPIRRLARVARLVSKGDLENIELMSSSPLTELDEAASSFNEMVTELKEKERIRRLFGKYVPESVAATILAEKGGIEAQETEATVLFADLEGFTALTERIGATSTVDLLNDYFSEMTEILERSGGVVTQFQGDAILATFNIPLADPEHASKAVTAAMEMQKAVRARTFGGQNIDNRIGINSGQVVAGAVGASDRLSYTVHGDAVNVAARLEQMNKTYGTRILLTEHTASQVAGIDFRAIGTIQVRGKTRPVSLMTPVATS